MTTKLEPRGSMVGSEAPCDPTIENCYTAENSEPEETNKSPLSVLVYSYGIVGILDLAAGVWHVMKHSHHSSYNTVWGMAYYSELAVGFLTFVGWAASLLMRPSLDLLLPLIVKANVLLEAVLYYLVFKANTD